MADAPEPQEGPDTPKPDPAPATPEADKPKVTPPWGSDEQFDPEKAWKLIQDLRSDKDKLSSRAVLTDEQKQQLDEYQALVDASKTDVERKEAELERTREESTRWQSEAQKWRGTAVGSRIQALAATEFADPSDAVGQLDPGKYLDAGGEIDDQAIKTDLAALLEAKPHWRRTSDTPRPRVPAPNPGQGSGGGSSASEPRDVFAAILQGQLAGE